MHTKLIVRWILIAASVAGFSAVSVALWGEKPEKQEVPSLLSLASHQTASEIARVNHLPLEPVLRGLAIDSSAAASTTLAETGLSAEQAQSRITRALVKFNEERSKNWRKIAAKFLLWFALLPVPFVLLRRNTLTPKRRRIFAGASVLIFGIGLGADPSPMGTVKDAVFLLTAHGTVFWPRIVALAAFMLTVILANKFICSWGCQFGLLQESIFRLNRNRYDNKARLRQFKPPFWLSNLIRTLVFGAAVLFGLLWSLDIIGLIDPFKVFNPMALTLVGGGFILLVLGAALFVYRPWCHFACPFGLLSWFGERISIFRIRVDDNKCTNCRACALGCPSHAMTGILDKKPLPPDCFSCGVCLNVCPEDAISFSAGGGRQPVGSEIKTVGGQTGIVVKTGEAN
jgi:ferredoxin